LGGTFLDIYHHSRQALGYFFATLIMFGLATLLYGHIEFVEGVTDGDMNHYRAMAKATPGIDTTRPTPWVYRILPPYLAGLLPFTINQSFWLWSILFSNFMLGAFFYLFSMFGISAFWSFFTLSLFVFNRYLFGIYIFNYFQLVDLLSLLFLILAFILLYKKKWLPIVLVTTLGALTKEVILLLTPTFVTYFYAKNSNKRFLKSFLVFLIPFFFYVLTHIVGEQDTGGYLIEQLKTNGASFFSFKHWGEVLINAFVPLSFIPIIFYEITYNFLRENSSFLILIVGCLTSTLLAGANERLMIPTAIPFYLLIGTIFEKWGEPRDWKVWGIFLLSFICLFHYNMGVFRHPEKIVMIITYIGSTLAVAGLSLIIKREKKPPLYARLRS
jgi:hypothetical protein